MATPKLAPSLIPRIDGPANGFLNRVCNKSPLTAKAPPAKRAVIAWGILELITICTQEGFILSDVLPKRMSITFLNGILTAPQVRFKKNRRNNVILKPIYMFLDFFIDRSEERRVGKELRL